MSYKVHVGFGFHVNCYHSYRGDTPDALGFGSDIRIMRNTIATLDKYNALGVPVKGTWDFENAFSLEEVLPKYAPDIIENVRRRQAENGDENILMGYNNGAMSAMTEDEFLASVSLAVTNQARSGLKDLFGGCEMIIRPQEVMFSPSQVPLYEKAGIECLCLYYSCVPFDAFRTIVPQLSDEYAFNPVNYIYQGKKLCVLPTYSHSDVMDAGSLRWLVCDLHQKQESGEINNDVFIFINIDADSFLWEPMPVPDFIKKIPNMNGLEGLILETCDLDFVCFDTPGGYIKKHAPLCDITFNEDVADGNFTGYASWSEKPFNRQIWTRLERARSMARLSASDKESPSFDDRIRLLSTTHFGLASPVMNIVREQKALEISEHMVRAEESSLAKENTFTVLNPSNSRFISAQLAINKGACFDITSLSCTDEGLLNWTASPVSEYEDGSIKSIFWMAKYENEKIKYQPKFSINEAVAKTDAEKNFLNESKTLKAGNLCFEFLEQGSLSKVKIGEKIVGGNDFLRSYICYDGKDYPFEQKKAAIARLAEDGEGLSISGEIHLPGELKAGCFRFLFYTVPWADGIFFIRDVEYPYTLEDHEISTSSSSLGRYSDAKWEQTVPTALTPTFSDNIYVIKRNFMNHTNMFPVADFWESVAENENIDSFNHQLSGGIMGLTDEKEAFFVVNARQSLNSMAHCPMRLRKTKDGHEVSMNPFGTYFGKQRHYPTRGNGSMNDMYVLTMPQARSLAPSYNGVHETAIMAFYGDAAADKNLSKEVEIPVNKVLYDEMVSFADGVVVVNGEDALVQAFTDDNVTFQDAKLKPAPKKLKGAASAGTGSRLQLPKAGLRLISNILKSQKKAKKYLK